VKSITQLLPSQHGSVINRNHASLRRALLWNAGPPLSQAATVYGTGEDLIYQYGGSNAGPHAVTSINNTAYSYDPIGREKTTAGRKTTYLSWRLPSRIVGTTASDAFQYDFKHQRILKIRSDGERSVTVGGLFERISKRHGPATDIYYVPSTHGMVAARVQVEGQSAFSVYSQSDRLGSIATVTDQVGIRVDNRVYDPFGTRRDPSNPSLPAPASHHDRCHHKCHAKRAGNDDLKCHTSVI
jgi:hypothetical protein